MKISTIPTTLLALSTAILFGVNVVAGECIADTTAIFEAEYASDLDPAVLREYVLCPNTTFDIGNYDGGTNSYVDGMAALEIVSPNIHILCGSDGRRENNCVMRGGEQHVFIGSFILGRSLENVLVSGVTFRDADLRTVQAAATTEGEGILFRDCLFQDITHVGAVIDAITFPGQNVAPLEMDITLDGCTFDSNAVVPFSDEVGVVGLVWNVEHRMNILNCEFVNNRAVVDENADFITWVIGNFNGGVMDVSGCLFENNTVSVGLIYEEHVSLAPGVDPGVTTTFDNIARGNEFFPTATTDESCDGLASHFSSFPNPFEANCTKFISSEQ